MHTPSTPLFTDVQITLFGMLARTLFGQDFTPPEDTDWEAVFREAHAQTVLLTAFCNVRGYGIPEETLGEIKRILRPYMMKDTVVHNAHTAIHTLLTENGIPYVIFKGAASAYFYPQTFLRGMGDVDFFVPDEFREKALSLLLENGFEESLGNEELHTVLKWRGVKYELHYDLPGVPDGPMGERVRELCESMVGEAILTKTDSATFVRPAPLHHGLILLSHTQQHLLCEGLGLRHICDWAVFVHSMGESFTALLEEPLKQVGLWRFARILSLVAVKAVGLPAAPWMTVDPADHDTAERLLADVLDGGNFGCKDTDRSRVYESQLISGDGQSDVDRSRVGNGLSAVNRWVKDKWPAAEKCPLLLPFGWIYFLIRRLFLVVTGKRKRIRVKETVRNSRKRQSLYQQLCLFKTEPPTKPN